MRVFYIDDEKGNTVLFKRCMPPSFDVLTFTDPLEAAAVLAEKKPDVIVSDEDMPGMRGIDLLAKAKELLPQSLRIIITGKVDINALSDDPKGGKVHFFVGKPYDPNFIINRIQTHFGDVNIGGKLIGAENQVVDGSYPEQAFENARAIYLEREKLREQMGKLDSILQDKTADLFMQFGASINYKNFKALLEIAHEDGHSYNDFQEIYRRFNSIKKGTD